MPKKGMHNDVVKLSTIRKTTLDVGTLFQTEDPSDLIANLAQRPPPRAKTQTGILTAKANLRVVPTEVNTEVLPILPRTLITTVF
jgi:hypothetical protein